MNPWAQEGSANTASHAQPLPLPRLFAVVAVVVAVLPKAPAPPPGAVRASRGGAPVMIAPASTEKKNAHGFSCIFR